MRSNKTQKLVLLEILFVLLVDPISDWPVCNWILLDICDEQHTRTICNLFCSIGWLLLDVSGTLGTSWIKLVRIPHFSVGFAVTFQHSLHSWPNCFCACESFGSKQALRDGSRKLQNISSPFSKQRCSSSAKTLLVLTFPSAIHASSNKLFVVFKTLMSRNALQRAVSRKQWELPPNWLNNGSKH